MKPNRPESDDDQGLRIVIAGGGTGGHLFPGIAIADAFKDRNFRHDIRFASVGKPFEIEAIDRAGYRLDIVPSRGLKGYGLNRQLSSLAKLPGCMVVAVNQLTRFKPDLVIGVGGYASGPVCMAAWFLGIPLVLHEQNQKMGISNRILIYLARRCYLSFEPDRAALSSRRFRHTGNPIRKVFFQKCDAVHFDRPDRDTPFTILVCGGSQGASAINQAVMDSLFHLPKTFSFLMIHQTGVQDEHWIRNAYQAKKVQAEVSAFFYDMAVQYGRADLMICRAGATTIAEITAIGKAAIFIPFPHAADNHQFFNAMTLVKHGAAEIIPEAQLNGKCLAERIRFMAEHPNVVRKMADQARKLGKPNAAVDIVDDCYRLLKGE
ncbi:MAG: undecaprenyldiphospho-muramoylpentapeptide beta-N-acetylglucosaminyltransferase [Desulfatirhabdiaceae bacterium]